MSMKAFVFDTETTGLLSNRKLPLDKQPHVIELYGCIADLDTGEIIEEIEALCKPPIPLPAIITKITGLNDAALKDASPFSAIAKRAKEMIEKSEAVVAHNLSFDIDMMELEYQRIGDITVNWPRRICTVEQTIHMKRFRLNLGALHETLFNEKFEGAHRARGDVVALLRCAVELRKREMI